MGNTVHQNTVHQNTVHQNTVHQNTVHQNTVRPSHLTERVALTALQQLIGG